jgi:hypothetical protein
MKNTKNILLSTVVNFELYNKTSVFFPAELEKIVFDGTTGMYGIDSIKFMFSKLKNKNIEWIVMADEDVVFQNSQLLFDIIADMSQNNYTVCGLRDGGVINHRSQNPYVINTFFSIINFKQIQKVWNKNEMLKNQYCKPNEFEDDLSNLKYGFDVASVYEPYYCFYFWLRRQNFKFLFLDSKMDEDKISNHVFYKNQELLIHTWYARSYGINKNQTARIDFILQNSKNQNSEPNIIAPTIYKNRNFAFQKKIKKLLFRIKRKLFE